MIPIDKLIEFTGFTLDELSQPSRKPHYVVARSLVYKHLTKNGYSFARAGAIFNQDHATVMNAVKKLSWIIETKTPLLYEQAIAFNHKVTACQHEMNLTTNDNGFYPFIYS